jgi:trans-2,3-dihydro-3-hydroxyanthranilate isomerase
MKNPMFYIVDVFAEEKYAGNQLAVFRNVSGLSDNDMQRFAKEMNFSETTFILSEQVKNGGYNVRIFTPEEELPFAGHPTLGTAFVIQREIIKEPVEKLALNLKVGQIPVTFSYKDGQPDLMWMRQNPPTFGKTLDIKQLAEVLALDEGDFEDEFPIQEVSTGVFALIVPLKTLEAVKTASVVKDKYFALIRNIESLGILVFAPETYESERDLNVRFFADALGIPEDPATGSANGCLAGYLVKHRYFDKDNFDIKVEQGYEIGRPSLLYLRAEDKDGLIDVHVGGKAAMVARGEFV